MASAQKTKLQLDHRNAEFTLNGKSVNLAVNTGQAVALQASDPEANAYRWQVEASPTGCRFQLTGESQVTASLTPQDPGTYVVRLKVGVNGQEAQAGHIVWAVTPRHGYRLPATGEPLRFNGDGEWGGDLARAMLDLDAGLLSPELLAALAAAQDPSQANPFITQRNCPAEKPPPSGPSASLSRSAMGWIERKRTATTPPAPPMPSSRTARWRLNCLADLPRPTGPSASPSCSAMGWIKRKRTSTTPPAPPMPSSRKPSWRPSCPADRPRPTGLSASPRSSTRASRQPKNDLPHAPGATNAFVTQSKLVSELPLGVTEQQHEGLKAAKDDGDYAQPHQCLCHPEQAGVRVTQRTGPDRLACRRRRSSNTTA